ncbi:MAG: hypothetical protein GXP10_04190 [Gammaproteobacteria bacterium]|nr:hypothetical protein [Gammaproteobacteria bacterium]
MMMKNLLLKSILLLSALLLWSCASTQKEVSPPPVVAEPAAVVDDEKAPAKQVEEEQAEVIPFTDESAPVEEASQQAGAVAETAIEEVSEKEVMAEPEQMAAEVVPQVVEPELVPLPIAKTEPVAPPPAIELPKDKNTFLVMAGSKDPSHPFYNTGSKFGFIVNGVQGKELVFVRGQTYTFAVDTGLKHDFYLSKRPAGWGMATVTKGVKGQFTYKGDVTFSPDATTPKELFYACRNHKFMGGKIHVINDGETVELGQSLPGANKGKGRLTKVTAGKVKNKISFANMMLAPSSPTAQRVESSSNADAKTLLEKARSQLESAQQLLSSGDNSAALAAADSAVRAVTQAAQKVPMVDTSIDYKARYEETLKSVEKYQASYAKHVKKGTGDKASQLDSGELQNLLDGAKRLAQSGRYKEANGELESAQDMLTAALGGMLQSMTVVYEKKFETLKEEYEWELSRNVSFEELVPIAIEQKHPSAAVVSRMNKQVDRSREIVVEAKVLGAKGDYKSGIMALQAATGKLQIALRIIGVGL